MNHVAQIQKLFDAGETSQALDAIDNLLILGPNNIEGLSLKAEILEKRMEYVDAANIWKRIAKIDPENINAINFFLEYANHDREYTFFSEPIGNGRRYLGFSRKMIHFGIAGMVGCVFFAGLMKLNTNPTIALMLQNETNILTLFGILVLSPWIGIIATWLFSLKSIQIDSTGLIIKTRLKTLDLKWICIQDAYLVYDESSENPDWSLVIDPVASTEPRIWIYLSKPKTTLAGIPHFCRDIIRHGSSRVKKISITDLPHRSGKTRGY